MPRRRYVRPRCICDREERPCDECGHPLNRHEIRSTAGYDRCPIHGPGGFCLDCSCRKYQWTSTFGDPEDA